MENMFIESLTLHQKLVDVIDETSNIDGYCCLTLKELGIKVGRCQTWVSQAIIRINTEDICIEKTNRGCFLMI